RIRSVLHVAGPRAIELQELLRCAHAGERPEEQGVDCGEDRGVQPDAERERDDDDGGEARVLDEEAPGESNITQHGLARSRGVALCWDTTTRAHGLIQRIETASNRSLVIGRW